MKFKFLKSRTLVIVSALVIIASCKKDNSKPASFVDDYSPQLTETAGISYAGDYYPIDQYYYWSWSGQSVNKGSMTMNVMGQKQTEPLDGTQDINAYMSIEPQTTISLASGIFNVYPTSETGGLTRYFLVTDTAICVKAANNSYDNSLIEIKEPVYFRKPLVVGAKWKSSANMDFEQLLEEEGYNTNGSDLTVKGAMFVVGKENVNWNSQNCQTVRVDERAEIKGTIDLTDSEGTGEMTMDITVDIKVNLLKNIGIISQKAKLTMNMSGTYTSSGTTASYSVNLSSDQTLTLDDYNVTATNKAPIAGERMKSAKQPSLKQYSGNSVANKHVQKIISVLKKMIQ